MPRRKIKKPVGHPPIYDPDHHPGDLIDKMSDLWLDVQVYAHWGISKMTFWRWRETHPEFNEAYQIGEAKFEAGVAQRIKDIGDGHIDGRHALNAWLAIANKKCKWAAPVQVGDTNININNMNVLASKSPQEILKIVQSNIKELELLDDTKYITESKPDQGNNQEAEAGLFEINETPAFGNGRSYQTLDREEEI